MGHADLRAPEINQEHQRLVYRLVFKMVKERELARELTQETLLKAHQYRASFAGQSQYTTWLYRIGTTTVLMYWRKKCEELAGLTAGMDEPDYHLGPDEWLYYQQLVGRWQTFMSPDDVALLVRRFLLGWSLPELQAELGCRLPALKSRLLRAKQRARSLGGGDDN